MSGAAIGWAKAQNAPSMIAKAVLICLADYADDQGTAWPSVPKLAAEVQISDRTVQRALRVLEEAGLLTVERHDRKDGGQTSNRYHLSMTPGDRVSPPRCQAVTPPVTLVSPANRTPYEPLSPDGDKTPARQNDFDLFWAAYPAKVGKKAAERAWRSAKDRPSLPSLLEALDRYRRTKPADRDWCNPATWLNQGRWMDGEPEANDTPASGPTFAGPVKLREAIAEKSGEPYARSYVDPCRWDADNRRLIAANPYALEKLTRDHGDLARAWKFAIVVEADNDHHTPDQGDAA